MVFDHIQDESDVTVRSALASCCTGSDGGVHEFMSRIASPRCSPRTSAAATMGQHSGTMYLRVTSSKELLSLLAAI